MKLIEGGSLKQALLSGSWSVDSKDQPQRAAGLLGTVARAVHHAHQRGILHRDLKPSNILLDSQGQPFVTDFGLAKRVEGEAAPGQSAVIVGTALYMAPEQAAGHKRLTTAADVYSLGAILYELLTGRPPFQGETIMETLLQVKERDPERPRALNPRLDRDLETICLKCLDKEPQRRYGSAEALADDLERWRVGETIQARRVGRVERSWRWCRRNPVVAGLSAAVLLVAALGLVGVLGQWQVALAHEQQANQQRDEARQQRDEAQRQRDEVRLLNDELRRTTYAAHINLAQYAWEAGDIGRVRELLEQHRPKPGESDLRGFEWHYLYRLCHAELLTLNGHRGTVNSVAYSPDGKRLTSSATTLEGSGKWTAEVKVWDAQTGQELLSLKGHSGPFSSVAYSPDGKRLATAAGGRQGSEVKVKVWDAQTGQELLTFKGLTSDVNSMAYSPDGKRLACSSSTWDTAKNAYGAGEVKIWDVQTGQELLSLNGAGSSVAFSPDGKRLATAAGTRQGGEVKVWDARTGQELLTIKVQPSASHGNVAFSRDGKRLAHVSANLPDWESSTMKVWDAQTGQEILTVRAHGQMTSVAFSPDGKRLVTGAGFAVTGVLIDRAVRVWDAQTGQEVLTLKGHTNEVTSALFSPDGSRLASASRDGTVKVWDATTSPEYRTFSLAGVSRLYSPDGKRLAGVIWKDNTVKLVDARTGQETLTLKGHTSRIRSVAFSPDRKRLAGASEDNTVKVWDAQTGQELLTLKGAGSNVAFSPDGKRLASIVIAGPVGEVKVWDAQTGQELLSLKGAGPSVAFSPDGKRLASGKKVWDAQIGQEVLTLQGSGYAMAFSPDGKRLAGGGRAQQIIGPSGSGEVKIWNAQTGQELFILKGHTSNVSSVAFSPDGERLASACVFAPTVKVWDVQTGEVLLSLKGGRGTENLTFGPNGHWLASDAGGRVWDATPLPEKP
jgi:eukaryotic-like serine/threonine-protein kinase